MFNIRWNKNDLLSFIDSHIIDYPTPINLNYMWSFGSTAGICLGIQIITGIFLAMHYTPHIVYAFSSVEHIMRDVNNGWLIRYLHANGASMFFIVVYCHIFRGLYFGSYMYPRGRLWASGVAIFFIMMATGFMGYVLPWGQMSFWGATVITNLFSAIPFVGSSIVEWLWGGFSVDNATLNRFYSLHYLLPFVLAAVIIIHFYLLHSVGSGNPLGIEAKGSINKISFYPYFYIKDLYGLVVFFLVFAFFVIYYPNFLGHSDNYIPADPMVTPAHIVPEWYFLPYYAILRAIPDKLGGVIAMLGAVLILYVIPFLNTDVIKSCMFKPISRKLFWWFVCFFLLLGWLGQNVAEEPYITIGRISEAYYFLYFLVLLPFIGSFEHFLIKRGARTFLNTKPIIKPIIIKPIIVETPRSRPRRIFLAILDTCLLIIAVFYIIFL